MVVTSQESTLNWPLSFLSPPLSHSPPPLPVLLGHPPPLNRQVLNTCLRVCFWSKRAGRVGIDCSGYSTHALSSGSPLPPLILWSAGLTPPLPPPPSPDSKGKLLTQASYGLHGVCRPGLVDFSIKGHMAQIFSFVSHVVCLSYLSPPQQHQSSLR